MQGVSGTVRCPKMARKCPSEPNPQSVRADWGERANSTKLEPSLHFESSFRGIQLLVVEEPSPVACGAHTILGRTRGFGYVGVA